MSRVGGLPPPQTPCGGLGGADPGGLGGGSPPRSEKQYQIPAKGGRAGPPESPALPGISEDRALGTNVGAPATEGEPTKACYMTRPLGCYSHLRATILYRCEPEVVFCRGPGVSCTATTRERSITSEIEIVCLSLSCIATARSAPLLKLLKLPAATSNKQTQSRSALPHSVCVYV